jgi:hypothetical protein
MIEKEVLLDIVDFVDISITPQEYDAVIAMYNSIYDKKIDSTNIINHVISLMKIVSSFQIDKIDKKKLVIFVVQKFIKLNLNNITTDEVEISFLNSFVENILPNLIDTICSIDSKKIIINTEKYVKTCCFPCFGKIK